MTRVRAVARLRMSAVDPTATKRPFLTRKRLGARLRRVDGVDLRVDDDQIGFARRSDPGACGRRLSGRGVPTCRGKRACASQRSAKAQELSAGDSLHYFLPEHTSGTAPSVGGIIVAPSCDGAVRTALAHPSTSTLVTRVCDVREDLLPELAVGKQRMTAHAAWLFNCRRRVSDPPLEGLDKSGHREALSHAACSSCLGLSPNPGKDRTPASQRPRGFVERGRAILI